MSKSHKNPLNYFPELNLQNLKLRTEKRWIKKYPEAKIQRVVLYRYSSMYQKYADGSIPTTKYGIVFEVPFDNDPNSPEETYKGLERDTEYYVAGPRTEPYRKLITPDFTGVYKNPPREVNRWEWNFFVRR